MVLAYLQTILLAALVDANKRRPAMQLRKLSEQVIVITGASSGIGRATAKMAAQKGARVMLTSRSEQELANVVAEIREAGGRASFHAADVTRADQVEAVARRAEREYGRIDTWVNNAGISAYGPIERLGLDDMRRVMDVTFWGVVNGTRTALPLLRKAGGGALINIGSEVSTAAIPLQGLYVAAKHAVAGFTDVLRQELEKERAPISVTLIRPGSIDTPFFRHAQSVTGREPAPPPPVYAPEMVADVILHCASHVERDIVVGGAARAMINSSSARCSAPNSTALCSGIPRAACTSRAAPQRCTVAITVAAAASTPPPGCIPGPVCSPVSHSGRGWQQ
jgi:short-subunit dehydrogenase